MFSRGNGPFFVDLAGNSACFNFCEFQPFCLLYSVKKLPGNSRETPWA